jgi:hypothetical protein
MSPEFAAALKKFETHIEGCERMLQPPKTPSEGTFLRIMEPLRIKHIPCGDLWRWNQAKRREEVPLSESPFILRISKLILRPKKGVDEIPPTAKIWAFEKRHPSRSTPICCAVWYQRFCEEEMDPRRPVPPAPLPDASCAASWISIRPASSHQPCDESSFDVPIDLSSEMWHHFEDFLEDYPLSSLPDFG